MHHPRTRPTRRVGALLLALTLALALVPGIASATAVDIYVDESTGSDTTGDGSSSNPYESITKGLVEASAGDTIWVAPGTYDTTVEPAFPILVKPGVAIRSTGGKASVRVDAEGTERVMRINDPIVGTMIEGLHITGGQPASGSAGGLLIYQASDVITEGWPKVVDCYIGNNTIQSPWNGGGIRIWTDAGVLRPEITGCAISENTADYGAGIHVGANSGGVVELQLEDCLFAENTARVSGGGIYTDDPYDITVSNTTFRDNWAGAGTGGGAVMVTSTATTSTASFWGCSFESNESSTVGGAISHYVGGALQIESTEFVGNHADGDGGAIYLTNSTGGVYFTDTFIYGNISGDDGAIALVSSSEATMTHSTVVNNTSADSGAMYVSGGSLEVFNSILWGNAGAEDFTPDGTPSVFSSCVEEADIAGPGVIHTDPEFKNPGTADYRLQNDSPCIDTGGPLQSDHDDIEEQYRPVDGDGDSTATPDMGCWERPALDVARYGGTNRYDTACQMAEAAFDSADTAIMASGEGFPDALSAAGLAGVYDAPLLLTAKDSVPGEVRATLATLGVDEVILVGGEAVISADVRVWLEGQGATVRRIAGANRYATSAAVAQEVATVAGADFTDFPAAFFARGDDFPDALAVAPLAYANGLPILLVQTDSLPSEIRNVMIDIDVELGYVCGGTGAVSATTKSAIDARLAANGGPPSSARWSGADRYATAAAIASGGENEGFVTFEYVGIATGGNFPDALAGGMLAGSNGGVVMLTQTDSLASSTRSTLLANRDEVLWAEVFGGTGVVNDAVKAAVDAALDW